MAIIRGILVAGLLACMALPQAPAWAQVAAATTPSASMAEPLVASTTRLTAKGSSIQLEMDFDQIPAFTFHYVDAPPRILVDLPATRFAQKDASIAATGLLKSVRYGAMSEGRARMVLTFTHPVKLLRSQATANPSGSGAHLLLEAERTTPEEYRKLMSAQTWETAAAPETEATPALPDMPLTPEPGAPLLVAVDAGHGGIDTGATGADGKTLEKDITLSFAKTLAEHLNREPGVQAFLTREKDEFLSLTQRVDKARERKASLFISFHADTLRQGDIRGATVYTISDKASDKLAASLAERENFSDELAGVKLPSEPEEVTDILLDLTRRETQAFSVTFAQQIIQSFKGQIGLINNPHRSAGFRVLRAPDIPSVLLELGFLSNPKDEKLLLDPEWREKIATLLTDAIRRYHTPDGPVAKTNGG